jgi:hypothetical protein
VVRNGGDLKARINAVAQAEEDRAFAADLRAWHPVTVAHLDDVALVEKVGDTRRRAVAFGIEDPRLRARYVMIGVVLAPEFWRQAYLHQILNSRTGSPDIRFGDVCAAIKVSLAAAGRQQEVWWI